MSDSASEGASGPPDLKRTLRKKPPLADAALSAEAQTAKRKLQVALKQNAGPRDEFFARQSKNFGGETGEDADGNKQVKGRK